MKRLLVISIVCLILSPAAQAQDNPLVALWPFGKNKAATPVKSARSDKVLGLPSPTAMIDKAEKSTEAAFQRTRDTWKGVKDFGRSLNPFAGNAKAKPKQKKSFLDRIMPKQPANQTPATVNDFLQLDRPKY